MGPSGLPRLNLGYNSPVICPSLTPWAPFWANWQCLGCLASTFSGFRVARRILPVLGPPGHPRLNLGYNYTGIFPFLTPWAPFWAYWNCLGCLASTFLGFRVAQRILPVFGPPGPPRLNLDYNLPSIGGFLTPWAPSWANWQYLGCLAFTFSGFRVARRTLPVLSPPGLLQIPDLAQISRYSKKKFTNPSYHLIQIHML